MADTKPPTALVVDDNPSFCQWVISVLEPEGFETAATPDPKEAIQRAYVMPPSVVLVDVALGHHDGFVVARKLRDIAPGVPLLLVSALDLKRASHVYMGLPRPVRLTKPIDRATLVEAVARAMKAVT